MNKLAAFLSSSMTGELEIERTAIRIQIKSDANLNSLIELYAIEEHASPLPIEKAYYDEVSRSKIYLIILGKELRDAVVKEFEAAIEHGLKIFCYIKNGVARTSELEAFIETNAHSVHCGYYYTADELVTKLKADLIDDITKSYFEYVNIDRNQKKDDYFVRSSAPATNMYRFFPVDELIGAAKDETINSLDRDQLISLSILMEEKYGDYRVALKLLEIGLLRDPNDWMLNNNRGVLLDKMGLMEASMYSYKKVLKYKPDMDSALYNVGNILMDIGRPFEAITYYEKCLSIFPEKIAALNRLAICNLQIGKNEEALACSERAVGMTEDADIKASYAMVLSSNGYHEKALKICDELESNYYYQSNTRSYIYFMQKEYEKSVLAIDSIIEIGALDYSLAIRKFYCLSALNRVEEARRWIEIIEENFPFRSQDYNNIGYELMQKYKLYDESIRLFRKALDVNSEEMITHNNLQSCLGYKREFSEALIACEKALQINPFDQKSIKNMMSSLTALGRFDESISFAVRKGLELFQNEALAGIFDENFRSSLNAQGMDINVFNATAQKYFIENL